MVEGGAPLGQRPADRAMALVIDAGEAMLKNGGEVFRAQATMEIMARSLGIAGFHVYVLSNGIFASAADDSLNAIRHVPSVSIHLGRVEAINAISRKLAEGTLNLETARAALDEAIAIPPYGLHTQLLAGGIGSGCFAMLFGGGVPEMIVAALAGFLETLLVQQLRGRGISRIFTDVTAAMACTLLSVGCTALYQPLETSIAIIGALMVLTPGVALTTGIRDIINADYLSGTIRLVDALLVAGCLAIGVALAYLLATSFAGVVL